MGLAPVLCFDVGVHGDLLMTGDAGRCMTIRSRWFQSPVGENIERPQSST